MQNFHKTNAHDLYDENLSVLLITSKQSFFTQLFSEIVNELIARSVMYNM